VQDCVERGQVRCGPVSPPATPPTRYVLVGSSQLDDCFPDRVGVETRPIARMASFGKLVPRLSEQPYCAHLSVHSLHHQPMPYTQSPISETQHNLMPTQSLSHRSRNITHDFLYRTPTILSRRFFCVRISFPNLRPVTHTQVRHSSESNGTRRAIALLGGPRAEDSLAETIRHCDCPPSKTKA